MQNITEIMKERLETAKLDCAINIENYIRVLKSDVYRLLLGFMDLQYSDIKIILSKNKDIYTFDIKVNTEKIYDLGSIID